MKYIGYVMFFLIIIQIFQSHPVFSQNHTLYNMPQIRQAAILNPAIAARCKFYLGIPVLTSVQLGINNTSFSYSDVFKPANNLYIIDIENIEQKLHNWNYVKADMAVSILGLGYKYKNFYFSFDIQNKTDIKIGYPNDFLSGIHGNINNLGNNNPLRLNPWAKAINYFEIAAGVSQQYTPKLRIGAKIKYLKGVATMQLPNPDIRIITEENMYDLQLIADIKANISFPLQINYNSTGVPQSVQMKPITITKDFIFNKNRGAAFDFGFIYNYSDKITFSGSVIDLGFIRWKTNTNTLGTNAQFNFNGFDIMDFLRDSTLSYTEKLTDSIQNAYTLYNNTNPFWGLLPAKIYLNSSYSINPKINAAVLLLTQIYNFRPYANLTVSLNFMPAKVINISISQTLANYQIRNTGLGLAFNPGPLQIYLITDNILVAFNPKKARMANIQLGINMYFGCNQKNKGKNKNPKASDICPAYN